MTQPYFTGVVKPKAKEAKLIPCGLAYTFWCACGNFQIAFCDEMSFGEAKCSACGKKSRLDVNNAAGKTPDKPSERKRDYTKAADKAQEFLG